MVKRKKPTTLPDPIEHLEKVRAKLRDEGNRRIAQLDRLKRQLIKDETARGKPLTEGGRRQVLDRFETAAMQVATLLHEESEVCRRLAVDKRNEWVAAMWAAGRDE